MNMFAISTETYNNEKSCCVIPAIGCNLASCSNSFDHSETKQMTWIMTLEVVSLQ